MIFVRVFIIFSFYYFLYSRRHFVHFSGLLNVFDIQNDDNTKLYTYFNLIPERSLNKQKYFFSEHLENSFYFWNCFSFRKEIKINKIFFGARFYKMFVLICTFAIYWRNKDTALYLHFKLFCWSLIINAVCNKKTSAL